MSGTPDILLSDPSRGIDSANQTNGLMEQPDILASQNTRTVLPLDIEAPSARQVL